MIRFLTLKRINLTGKVDGQNCFVKTWMALIFRPVNTYLLDHPLSASEGAIITKVAFHFVSRTLMSWLALAVFTW